MQQYRTDYLVSVETKQGKIADIFIETSEAKTQIRRFEQYNRCLKGEKA